MAEPSRLSYIWSGADSNGNSDYFYSKYAMLAPGHNGEYLCKKPIIRVIMAPN